MATQGYLLAKAAPSVAALIAALDQPLKPAIEPVRALARGANAGIIERMTWNAPRFCYADDDRVTLARLIDRWVAATAP